ncbi:MAG: minor capsid protein [Oscillospiraceae bacterium]|nr:minor capsid protein [Oscillospiraceae bacterium]
MRHIPYRLLDGSCILRNYGEMDIFGGREIISETKLERVRIELFLKKDASKNGEALFSCGRLYYDCGRSIPEEADFSADGGCSVIIRDREYQITELRYHFVGGKPAFIVLELGG